jgi:pyroglutamyl-peptidase
VKVLVTGFEPFGGDAVNSSWEAVRLLADHWDDPDGTDLVPVRLPVTFEGAVRVLEAAVADNEPDVVVCTGLAAGAEAVRVERVAVNVADARIPDNASAQPVDEEVVAGGPVAYLSGLPLKATLVALRDAGIPAVVSNSAGTYVCNAVFYALCHLLAAAPDVRGGFVHLPRTVEEGGGPDGGPQAGALPAAVLARALEVIVRTAIDARRGLVAEPALPAGSMH